LILWCSQLSHLINMHWGARCSQFEPVFILFFQWKPKQRNHSIFHKCQQWKSPKTHKFNKKAPINIFRQRKP
jgi:hypothetical protein